MANIMLSKFIYWLTPVYVLCVCISIIYMYHSKSTIYVWWPNWHHHCHNQSLAHLRQFRFFIDVANARPFTFLLFQTIYAFVQWSNFHLTITNNINFYFKMLSAFVSQVCWHVYWIDHQFPCRDNVPLWLCIQNCINTYGASSYEVIMNVPCEINMVYALKSLTHTH